MNLRDGILAALLVVLGCVAVYFLLPAYTRYQEMRLAVDKLEESLAAQRQELEELRRELAALRTDHRAIERVAREKFGLCREDEQIYHFDAAPAPAREPLKRAGSQPAPEGAPPANP